MRKNSRAIQTYLLATITDQAAPRHRPIYIEKARRAFKSILWAATGFERVGDGQDFEVLKLEDRTDSCWKRANGTALATLTKQGTRETPD